MCVPGGRDGQDRGSHVPCMCCAHQPVSGADLRLELALLSAPIGLELPTVTQTYQLHLTDLQT